MLRELRERAGVGLRAIARNTSSRIRLSDSHLSRVERGERPVTPAVLTAYERALGIVISDDVAQDLTAQKSHQKREWEEFQATIVAVAGGGRASTHHDARLLEAATVNASLPSRIGPSEVVQVEQAALFVRSLDLRHGGELAGRMAYQLLRCGYELLAVHSAEAVRRQLNVAVGSLAAWAGWSACDSHRFAAARALLSVALNASVRADEPDLRAHILVDIAALRNYLGHRDEALRILRLADGDERINPAIRSIVHGARARVYGAVGDRNRCGHAIQHAEDAADHVEPRRLPAWLGGWQFAHVQAMCGQAYSLLAQETGDLADLAEAHKRLTIAADDLSIARPRAAALCYASLARAHLTFRNHDELELCLRHASRLASSLQSVRLRQAVSSVEQALDRSTIRRGTRLPGRLPPPNGGREAPAAASLRQQRPARDDSAGLSR